MASDEVSWDGEEDNAPRRRRRGLCREEVAVVLAAVATVVVLIQRFVEEQRFVLMPGNALAALQSSMQATAMALAKLQMVATKSASLPSRLGVDGSWFEALWHSRDDGLWRESLRMSRATFIKLLDTLGSVLQRQDTNMKEAIPAERKLGSALYRLAHGATFKAVARRFGIGTSSCCKAFYEVCKGLEERLGHLFEFPAPSERLRAVCDGYALLGMPNCCGAIGCTSFAVERPLDEVGVDYLDQSSNCTVLMQGVVDASSRFLDISVGWPGCIPPAAILLKTRFFSRVEGSRELLQGSAVHLGTGFPVPQYVLADGSYPLRPWLVTPYYPAGHQVEAVFNKAHRQAMTPLRKAFGMLKGQWQLLRSRQRLDNMEMLPFIVAAACVLQNFLIDNAEPMPEVEELEDREVLQMDSVDVQGQAVRNSLANFICTAMQ